MMKGPRMKSHAPLRASDAEELLACLRHTRRGISSIIESHHGERRVEVGAVLAGKEDGM
jgi:hypothetical protein